jgi:hypothetical protein
VAQIVEAAQREAERITAAAGREQAAFAERRDELQAHLDHIRTTLTALTGATDAPDPAAAPDPASFAPDGSEGATAEVPLPVTDLPAEAGPEAGIEPGPEAVAEAKVEAADES